MFLEKDLLYVLQRSSLIFEVSFTDFVVKVFQDRWSFFTDLVTIFKSLLQISQRFYMVPWNSWHVFQGSLNIQHTVPVQGFSSFNLVAVQCQPLVINLFKHFSPLFPVYILVFLLCVWTILTLSVKVFFFSLEQPDALVKSYSPIKVVGCK